MSVLLIGLVLFVGMHATAVVGVRDRAVEAMGEGVWKTFYSVVSLAGLVAMVYGYGLARQAPTVLWSPPVFTRHLAFLLMVPVFPLLLAAYLPGRIRTATKHPMLTGTKAWATAHLVANGMLADVVLFGSILAWAVAVRVSLKRRGQRPITMAPPAPWNDAIAVVVGLVLYAAFLGGLHGWLIGMPLL